MNAAEQRFELPAGGGLVVRGEALIPPNAHGAVVLCHGFKGFARWGFFPHLADRLLASSFRVVRFDFSGSGIGVDGERFSNAEAFARNTYTLELDDLRTVIAEAERRHWLVDGFALFGHSRGGGIAILHAARAAESTGPAPPPRALVTWSAIASTRRWTEDEAIQWRERGYREVANTRTGEIYRLETPLLDEVEQGHAGVLSIENAAARVAIPWLIVHGEADESVPVAEARLLARRARPETVLHLVPAANHAFGARHPLSGVPRALESAMTATLDFLRAELR